MWTLPNLIALIDLVKYPGLTFTVRPIGMFSYVLYVEAEEVDHTTGKPVKMSGRKFLIPCDMTKDDVVRTCFVAVMAWVEHEARESFSYRGAAIFEPHFDVDEQAMRAPHYLID